jgi:glycosyltransferase involved in cell wall biosynthesis
MDDRKTSVSSGVRDVVMVLSNCHAPLGGTQKQALRLARQLAARGLSVSIVCKRRPVFKAERGGYLKEFPVEETHGIDFVGLASTEGQPAWSFLLSFALWAWRHRRHLGIIHAHNVRLGVISCLVGWALGKKVIIKVPAWEFVEYLRGRGLSRRLRRWLVRTRADRLVAVNADIAHALAEAGISPDRIALIPNGIDLPTIEPSFDPLALRRDALGDGGLGVVLFVGRLVKEKSVDRLLTAWASLPEREQYRLVIVGDGPLRGDLVAMAETLGVLTSVRFMGYQSDVASFYAMADVFVLPSRTEGLSNALLEAMVAGLPVVVSNITGNRQLVDEGSGVVVGWQDTAGWVEALSQLLGDEALRRKLGETAKRRVRAFAISEIATCYQRLYETVTQS